MSVAFLIAGPAVLLAIIAWAADRFMPVPSMKQQSRSPSERTKERDAVRDLLARSVTPPQTFEVIRRNFDQAEDAEEFSPLAEALSRFEIKRSKSMDKDNYPNPKMHKYDDSDMIQLSEQRIVFEKNGRARVESRNRGIRA